MSFQLVPKSVTLNDLEWRNGRYFTEFGKLVFRPRRSMAESSYARVYSRIYESIVFCSACTMSS